jgi:hypothetical protein
LKPNASSLSPAAPESGAAGLLEPGQPSEHGTADQASEVPLAPLAARPKFSAFPSEVRDVELKEPTRLPEEEHRQREKERWKKGPWTRDEIESYQMGRMLKQYRKGEVSLEAAADSSAPRLGQEFGKPRPSKLRGLRVQVAVARLL